MNIVTASKLNHPNKNTPETTTRQILSVHKLPYTCGFLLLIFIRKSPPFGKKVKLALVTT